MKWLLACSIIDVHTSIVLMYSYTFTSITSVMMLQNFTVPSAVIMSILFLKVRYKQLHYIALAICASGLALSIYNDYIKKEKTSAPSAVSTHIIGDIMALLAAFGFTLINVL